MSEAETQQARGRRRSSCGKWSLRSPWIMSSNSGLVRPFLLGSHLVSSRRLSRTNQFRFCADIQEIVSTPCSSEDLIDNALRAYLNLAAQYKGNQPNVYPPPNYKPPQRANQSPRIPTEEYLQSEFEVARCSFKLLSSTIFVAHSDYVRRQMIYALLQVPLPICF